jgi:hypothetical protein
MRFKAKAKYVEAKQFKTNNEVGSPHMDSLVNWINQGLSWYSKEFAWHNGTNIIICKEDGGRLVLDVTDWIVIGDDRTIWVHNNQEFQAMYESWEGA